MDLAFNIIRKCNKSCEYCYLDMNGESLSLDEIKKVVSELENVRKVTITGGEPLIHPQIFDIINFLNKKTDGINLLTNGIELTDENTTKLENYDIELFITYNTSNEILLKNMKTANKKGIPINIHHVLTEDSLEHLEEICSDLDFAKKILFLYPTDMGDGKVKMYGPGKWNSILDRAIPISEKHINTFYEPAFVKSDELDGVEICPSGKDIFIDSDGKSYPCCLLTDTMDGKSELKPVHANPKDCPFISKYEAEDGYERICPLLISDVSRKTLSFPSRLDDSYD